MEKKNCIRTLISVVLILKIRQENRCGSARLGPTEILLVRVNGSLVIDRLLALISGSVPSGTKN